MINTNQTLKQQVKITPEFLEDVENGVNYFLKHFEKETGNNNPFYYLTHFSDDIDKNLYTLRLSTKKEKYAYYTVNSSDDYKEMEKQKRDFIKLNKHLNMVFKAIDWIEDDFIKNRATLQFEIL